MPRTPEYATKKDLLRVEKKVEKLIKKSEKGIKKWDVKQDKKLLKKKNS
jgi:hypothetical protein